MKYLAIDTSTEAQVLGLHSDGELYDATAIVGREHSQLILPAIDKLVARAGIELTELTGIVFGQGPGSFTGLRIGIGVVQGLAYGLDIPVVPVSTLAVLAQGAHRETGSGNVVVALHARKQEVFFGSYSIVDGYATRVGEEGVFDADEVPAQQFDDCVGVGDGWQFQASLERALNVTASSINLGALPDVQDLLEIGIRMFESGDFVTAIEAQPEYLREQIAAPPNSK